MIQYDSNGIITQNLTEIINEYEQALKPTFGDDFVVDKNTPIGSIILAMATNEVAIHELIGWLPNMMNANTASGVFLDYICEKNKIYRDEPQKTKFTLTINGTKETQLYTNDITVLDKVSNITYNLNQDCVIGEDGTVKAEFVCEYDGDYAPSVNSDFQIQTPVPQVDSVTFDYANSNIIVGRLYEQDEQLRNKRNQSVGQCSTSTLNSIKSMIVGMDGVNSVIYIENENETTQNGVPAKSFEFVVDGGDESEIVNAIFINKVPGSKAYGTTVVTKTDEDGNVYSVGYTKAEQVNVGFDIDLEVSAIQSNAWVDNLKQTLKQHFEKIQKIGVTVKDYNYTKILTDFPEITDIKNIKIFNTKTPSTLYSQLPIGKKQIAKLIVDNIDITMEH